MLVVLCVCVGSNTGCDSLCCAVLLVVVLVALDLFAAEVTEDIVAVPNEINLPEGIFGGSPASEAD